MDTRWTKFKFSSLNKFLCALIACVFAALFVLNGVPLFGYVSFFGAEAVLSSENADIYSTNEFNRTFSDNLQTMIDDVSHNENQKAYDEAKQKTVDMAVQLFERAKAETESGTSNENDGNTSENDYDREADDNYDTAVTEYHTNYYDSETEESYYAENDAFGYNPDVQDRFIHDTLSFSCNLSDSTEEARAKFNKQFGDQIYYRFCHDTAESGETAELGLQNIKYYAEYPDGSVVSNVENKDEFISNIKNGVYYILENGNEYKSNEFKEYAGAFYATSSYYGNTINNIKLYASVNESFSGDDDYGELYKTAASFKNLNHDKCLYICMLSLAGMIVFLVISVRLAGHKENDIQTAAVDKLPNDLHLAFSVLADTGIGFLIIMMAVLFYESNLAWFSNNDTGYIFASSQWSKYALAAAGILFYLVVLELFTSIARSIKAGKNIFKNTLIYMLLSLLVKFEIWLFKGAKSALKELKGVIKTFVYRHEKLEKKIVLTVLFYMLFNIVSALFIWMFFAAYNGFADFLGVLGVLALMGIDIFIIYKAAQYMKALDMIIIASEKREPLEINTDSLPQSLKILADSLEATNADLQSAVIKAVKDERTKTELITNVSHDLKTPLTSVINYIDLLKKCNIEDETAKKYMAVIDEKSNKLKRLIEDLIEASKVSSGNVTINKTKLNLNELAAQAIVEETADIEKNNLQIIFDESTDKHIVFADGTKLYRVFENLLSNARKYSAAGSRIYAKVYSDNHYGCFELKNISKDPLNISAEELTERFVRGDASRSQDGNGLGLSIAKELCRLNGGELIITIDGDLFKATVKMPKE